MNLVFLGLLCMFAAILAIKYVRNRSIVVVAGYAKYVGIALVIAGLAMYILASVEYERGVAPPLALARPDNTPNQLASGYVPARPADNLSGLVGKTPVSIDSLEAVDPNAPANDTGAGFVANEVSVAVGNPMYSIVNDGSATMSAAM